MPDLPDRKGFEREANRLGIDEVTRLRMEAECRQEGPIARLDIHVIDLPDNAAMFATHFEFPDGLSDQQTRALGKVIVGFGEQLRDRGNDRLKEMDDA